MRSSILRLAAITALACGWVHLVGQGAIAQSVRLWTPDPLVQITEAAVPSELPRAVEPIQLVAPRNGAASGLVVVVADRPLQRVRAAASALRHEDGRATIAGPQVQVRYATRHRAIGVDGRPEGEPGDAFIHLLDRHVPDGRIQPVWVTVDVPASAEPGIYRGSLRIAPGGTVPIELTVSAWTSPDPAQFTTHAALMHSPDTVARHYDVPKWSRRHFELLVPAMRLLGRIGNDVLYLPMVNQTHLGNNETIVQWVPRGGGHVPDFTAFEHYLRLYDRHAGRPSVLCLYMWENSWRDDNAPTTLSITERNPRTGQTRAVEVPYYGLPGSEAYWRPLIEGVRQRVAAVGWDPDIVMIGVVGDGMLDERTRDFFLDIAPNVKWVSFTHARGHPRPRGEVAERDGLTFGYRVLPYRPRLGSAHQGYYLANWRQAFRQATSMRIFNSIEPSAFRYLPHASMAGDTRGHRYGGFDRIGMDFWPVEGGALLGRYHRWFRLMRQNHRAFTAPGPEGVMGSVLIEMLREGLTETEAQISIERIMLDDELRNGLQQDLRDRIEATLEARHGLIERLWENPDRIAGTPWRQNTTELFDLAETVRQAMEDAY